eukprot:958025-Lingulodinium_polyedra.AAC.1
MRDPGGHVHTGARRLLRAIAAARVRESRGGGGPRGPGASAGAFALFFLARLVFVGFDVERCRNDHVRFYLAPKRDE